MLDTFKQGLTGWKDAVATVNGLITIAAIFVSAYWSYRLFVRRRLGYPRADITQTVSHRHIRGGKVFVRATVIISNKGESLLTIEHGFTRFLVVAPYDPQAYDELDKERTAGGSRIDWRMCGKVRFCPSSPREIEPGETDEIHFDLIADDWLQTIIAHTCLENPKKRKRAFVWEKSTIYDVKQIQQPPARDGGNLSADNAEGKLTGLQTRVDREPVQAKPMATNSQKGSGHQGAVKPAASPNTLPAGDGKVQTVVDQEPKPVTPPKQK